MATDVEEAVFEVGLVMAGAISAGAYTAGVVDFLFEALDQWERQRGLDPTSCPPHRVKLKVAAGASAGAICSAIMGAAAAGVPQSPQRPTKLYESWVERIDIEHLLKCDDLLDPGTDVVSLLDSTVLNQIAVTALDLTPCASWPHYVSAPFHVYLSLSNLRGVPYAIREGGDVRPNALYEMTSHADYLHFAIGGTNQVGGTEMQWEDLGIHWLDPARVGVMDVDGVRDIGDAAWSLYRDAALSSAAFPVGLAPRILERPRVDYDHRRWVVPLDRPEDERWNVARVVPPNWGDLSRWDDVYRFHTVDGGIMDNEPLEMARRQLAGVGGRNDRRGEYADRAVIMIDPFPDSSPVEPDRVGCPPAPGEAAYEPHFDILTILAETFFSLVRQARFKKEEILLAEDDHVFSRFLVAPTRQDRTKDGAIASGACGGFGGFFHRSFREHDYALGRRNCQKFLRDHFVLKERNPLFANAYWAAPGRREAAYVSKTVDGERCLPIVPLCGTAAIPIADEPEWPVVPAQTFKPLRRLIEKRMRKIAGRFIGKRFSMVPALLIRTVMWLFWFVFCGRLWVRRRVLDSIVRKLMVHGIARR